MLNAVLFIADPQLAALIRSLASKSNEFSIGSAVQFTEIHYSVARTLNTTNPDVVLVEMTEFGRDMALATAIRQHNPDLPVVGLASRDFQGQLASNSSNSNFGSLVVWPFTLEELEAAISSAVHKVHGALQDNLVACLPGKAGSGSSTIVLNTARVLAQELRRRVLVMEADLHSGLLSAMLNVEVRSSIRSVLAEAPRIDNLNWKRDVISVGGVDFLLTINALKEPVPSWTHYFQILRFAGSKYDFILVDLPEVVNSATAEVVRRARTVYVVSTPELASLKLSRQRCLELDRWNVDRGRIQTLLNRAQRGDIGSEEAERILGYPVAATFPNDFKLVQKAIRDASPIDVRSRLGQAYLSFAKQLTGEEKEKRSFRDLFRK